MTTGIEGELLFEYKSTFLTYLAINSFNNMTTINQSFKAFVDECITKNGCLLTNNNDLFTRDNIIHAAEFLKNFKPWFDQTNKDARETNKKKQSSERKVWNISDIFSGDVFELKDFNEYKKDIVIPILLHCHWLMYLCSEKQNKRDTTKYYKDDIDSYFQEKTMWSISATLSGISYDAMLFILKLVQDCKETKESEDIDIYTKIKERCNNSEWKKNLTWKDGKSVSSDAIVNILLFFCDSEHYLPIPAQDKKDLISEKLSELCKESSNNVNTDELEGMSEVDRNLYNIRKTIKDKYNDLANKESDLIKKEEYNKIAASLNPFWRHDIRPFWDESTEDTDNEKLSDETLLDYKKAMILYGPPGTSKSYQARRIAESMIAKALRKNEKSIDDCINKLQSTLDSHIHILQMHPNYTYDDFIVGKSIEGNKIVVKPGKMLQIIAGIDDNDNLPHFVILDEINRVDISRVFGELFTAMESSYREKGVELSVDVNQIPEDARINLTIDNNTNKLFLKVPENMYFIGTMNMIDFSLEQVDFALRRRFLWELSTYNRKRLNEIIREKIEEKIRKIQEEIEQKPNENKKENEELKNEYPKFPDNFIECCSSLNKVIKSERNLGEDYLIGHAFFAEIVDIFEKVKKWEDAKNILWQVSIQPTLKAYCGTMDVSMQDQFIDDCKKAFFPSSIMGKNVENPSQAGTEKPIVQKPDE